MVVVLAEKMKGLDTFYLVLVAFSICYRILMAEEEVYCLPYQKQHPPKRHGESPFILMLK